MKTTEALKNGVRVLPIHTFTKSFVCRRKYHLQKNDESREQRSPQGVNFVMREIKPHLVFFPEVLRKVAFNVI
jgi:hypothetical protein